MMTKSSGFMSSWFFGPLVFGSLTLAIFYDVLFASHSVVSASSTDLALQFIPWREFGFSQLRLGNLPLWNPHIFGGAPYFAGFQAGLLYPPNWLHLFLPVSVAINWIVAMHVFMAGYFTFLWCRCRELSPGGSIVAGIMFMFCGPYFLHLYAGHLPHLAVMVWAPLQLLAIDKLAQTGCLRWCLLGIFATAMHILAGHPQYVYYTGIILGIYALAMMFGSKNWPKVGAGFVIIYAGAVFLTAVQLLPGFEAANEQVRSGGLPYNIASTFSLAPANLITLLAPNFFGGLNNYWGAGYLWEMSLFLSINGSVLAIYGVIRGHRRTALLILTMIAVIAILAFGRHLYPIYRLLFDILPGYSSFRGVVKFAYLMALFIALLAGMGFDALLIDRRVASSPIFSLLALGIVMAIAAAMIWTSAGNGADGAWTAFVRSSMDASHKAGEMFTFPDLNSVTQSITGRRAAMSLFVASGILIVGVVLLWAVRFHRWIPLLFILAIGIEMFVFARTTRATMDPVNAVAVTETFKKALAGIGKDDRVLTLPPELANRGMVLGFDNIAGYDPGVLKRYAELIYAAEGLNPSAATQYLFPPGGKISFNSNIARILRCGLIVGEDRAVSVERPLPTAYFVSNWVKLTTRDSILRYLLAPTFDPANTVVLEADPDVQTEPAAVTPPGSVRVLNRTTDSLELQADLDRPAILVVTNNYSTGWRIVPIESPQKNLRIVPANYTHMAVALEKGKHHFLLEYSPLSFRIGRWVSIFTLLAICVAVAKAYRMKEQPSLVVGFF